jgi:hypothetical protein
VGSNGTDGLAGYGFQSIVWHCFKQADHATSQAASKQPGEKAGVAVEHALIDILVLVPLHSTFPIIFEAGVSRGVLSHFIRLPISTSTSVHCVLAKSFVRRTIIR